MCRFCRLHSFCQWGSLLSRPSTSPSIQATLIFSQALLCPHRGLLCLHGCSWSSRAREERQEGRLESADDDWGQENPLDYWAREWGNLEVVRNSRGQRAGDWTGPLEGSSHLEDWQGRGLKDRMEGKGLWGTQPSLCGTDFRVTSSPGSASYQLWTLGVHLVSLSFSSASWNSKPK